MQFTRNMSTSFHVTHTSHNISHRHSLDWNAHLSARRKCRTCNYIARNWSIVSSKLPSVDAKMEALFNSTAIDSWRQGDFSAALPDSIHHQCGAVARGTSIELALVSLIAGRPSLKRKWNLQDWSIFNNWKFNSEDLICQWRRCFF